jgi:dienelactone hydrolase
VLALAALFAVRCGGDDSTDTSGASESPVAGSVGTVAGIGSSGTGAAGSGVAGRNTMVNAGTLATAGMSGAGAGGMASGMSGSGAGQASVAGAGGSGAGGSGAAGSSAAGSSAAAGAGAAGSSANAGAWPVADISAAGPFESMTVMNSGPNSGYMLFFPQDLGRDGLKHPIITWGNGAGTMPRSYTLLPRLATHGFVVIASNSSSVTGALLKGGVDWLITENGREGSMFKDKLDPDQVAAMGYSLGSLATFDTAADPRIKTTVHISGGSMNKMVVGNLRKPAAFYCGNDSDIAYSNCESDFAMTKVPTIYANFPGGHGGVIGAQAAQISKATVGWLRWRLMGDTTLDAMFVGPDCTLCKDSAWDKVQQKSLDTPPP